MTTARGFVCVPRKENGILLRFGVDPESCSKTHATDLNNRKFESLNCLRNKYI